MILILKGANFSEHNIGTLDSWFITKSIGSGATVTSVKVADASVGTTIPGSIKKNSKLEIILTVADGIEFTASDIVVTMSGSSITPSISGKTITISIPSVTNHVDIKVNIGAISGGGSDVTTPINLTLYKSAGGNSILDYQNVWKMFGANSLATLGSQIIGVDVSAYTGQTITITAAQSVISGANYAMFCSNFPNAYVNSLTELQGYNSFGTATNYIAENYENLIESFNISTTAETTNSVTKVVPANAKYLFFANLNTKCANPSVVVGNIAEPGTTLVTYTTEDGWCCMDYQTYFYLTANSTFKGYQSKVLAVDVSALNGKTLSITATQSVVDGAYYAFFTNKLPTGISSIEQIEGLTYSATGKYNFSDKTSDLVGESFNVSTEHQVVNTITKVVPTGAKYLFVNTLNKFGSSEIKLN